jgi:hypothetical protein
VIDLRGRFSASFLEQPPMSVPSEFILNSEPTIAKAQEQAQGQTARILVVWPPQQKGT